MITYNSLQSKPKKAEAVTLSLEGITDQNTKDKIVEKLQEFVGEMYLVVLPNKAYPLFKISGIGVEDPSIEIMVLALQMPFPQAPFDAQLPVVGMVPFINNDYIIKAENGQVNVCPAGTLKSLFDVVSEHPWVSFHSIKREGNVIDVDFVELDKDLGKPSLEADRKENSEDHF